MKGVRTGKKLLGLEARRSCGAVKGSGREQSSNGLGKWKSRRTESMAFQAVGAMCTTQPSD